MADHLLLEFTISDLEVLLHDLRRACPAQADGIVDFLNAIDRRKAVLMGLGRCPSRLPAVCLLEEDGGV